MKSIDEIRTKVADLRIALKDVTEKHSKLDQISMLSSEGAKLRERKNMIRGELIAFYWVTGMVEFKSS